MRTLMTILAATVATGQVIDLTSGTGHVQVNHTGCEVIGKGPGRTVITLDGTYPTAFQPTVGVDLVTIRDLTIDCAYRPEVLSAIGTAVGGLSKAILHNVEIVNLQRPGIPVVNGGALEAYGLSIYGDAGGIQSLETSTSTLLRSVTVRGGRFGFVNSDGAELGTTPGIDIDGMDVDHGYFASPAYEAVTVTGFDSRTAFVESHVANARDLYDCLRILTPVLTFDTETTLRSPLVRVYDRAETADGRWAEVLGILSDGTPYLSDWHAAGKWSRIATPSAEATLYRPILGRLFGHQTGQLHIRTTEGTPAESQWRYLDGAVAVPSMASGVRLDIIRHGASPLQPGQTRDVDTGGITINRTALNPVVRRCSVRRGFSDLISVRGIGGVTENCLAELGQDMGFTVDASFSSQIVRRCQAQRIGNFGFYLAQFLNQPISSRLESCTANNNGAHGYGYGFAADFGADGTFITGRGSGNSLGLTANCEITPGGFERRTRPHHRATRRRRWD